MPLNIPLSQTHKEKMRGPRPIQNNNQRARKKGYAPVGMSRHPLYQLYYHMIRQCTNEKDRNYKYFGAKGIQVCTRWQEKDGQGFLNFLEDVKERPLHHNLERLDNTKNFDSSNCVWRESKF